MENETFLFFFFLPIKYEGSRTGRAPPAHASPSSLRGAAGPGLGAPAGRAEPAPGRHPGPGGAGKALPPLAPHGAGSPGRSRGERRRCPRAPRGVPLTFQQPGDEAVHVQLPVRHFVANRLGPGRGEGGVEGAPQRRRRSRERRPQRQWLPPAPPPAVPGGRPASPAPSQLNGRTRPPLLPAPPPLLRSRQGACAASPAAAAPRPASAQARRARWRRRGAGPAVPRCSPCPGGLGRRQRQRRAREKAGKRVPGAAVSHEGHPSACWHRTCAISQFVKK